MGLGLVRCRRAISELSPLRYRNGVRNPLRGAVAPAAADLLQELGARERGTPVGLALLRESPEDIRRGAVELPDLAFAVPTEGPNSVELLEGRAEFAGAWNFGPDEGDAVEVEALARKMKAVWPALDYELRADPDAPHEARMLKLDSSLARHRLGWRPVWGWEKAVEMTASWYRTHYETRQAASRAMLHEYARDARSRGVAWSVSGEGR